MASGAEIVTDFLKNQGVEAVFTFPGGTIAPTLDALQRKKIELVCARHEQGAGYMALAASRILGKPQVVMVTSGPGVTNLATVIADAYFDSVPLIGITGQVGTGDLLSGRQVRQVGFQEVDTVGLMKPISKAMFRPLSLPELRKALDQAFALAQHGRPGPVVIDLPMNIQLASEESSNQGQQSYSCSLSDILYGEPFLCQQSIIQLAEWISSSQRPLLLLGQGIIIAQATKETRWFSEQMQIPAVSSILGLGAVASFSPYFLGFLGHTGNRAAGKAVQECDLLLVIGARLDVRQTGTLTEKFAPLAKIIRIDIDANELNYSRIKIDLKIHADLKQVLQSLKSELEGKKQNDRTDWLQKIVSWKKAHILQWESNQENRESNQINRLAIKPQQIIETASKLTAGKKVIVTSGVGAHQQWTARHFEFDYPQRIWLTSGGHGTMGFDLPAAAGAQWSCPQAQVWCFVGDGSFQLNLQELQTIIDYQLSVKIIVLDNSRLGLVSQFQLLNWKTDPTTGHKKNPDFAAIARAYGIPARTIANTQEVEEGLQWARDYTGPVLVHCLVAYHEDVCPMLLAGQTLDQMWP